MKKQKGFSLTATAELEASCSSILSRVSVASGDGSERVDDVLALWDTGATSCFISRPLARRLKLKKIGESDVSYADGQRATKDLYIVRLTFQPSGREIHVYAAETNGETQDFIVGMNIIGNGRFLLEPDGKGGMRFTFEAPA